MAKVIVSDLGEEDWQDLELGIAVNALQALLGPVETARCTIDVHGRAISVKSGEMETDILCPNHDTARKAVIRWLR